MRPILQRKVTPNFGKCFMYPFLAEADYRPPESPLFPPCIVVRPEFLAGTQLPRESGHSPGFPGN